MRFNEQTKKILIISLFFAPSAMVGGKRFSFLSRILQKKYPELHVLTLKKKYISPQDKSLKYGGTIHRSGMYPPHPINKNNLFKRVFNRLWEQYLCFLDPFCGWILPAIIKGLKIIKDYKIDLIIVTCPPFSPVAVGFMLSLLTGAKLIIDYRDPWTSHDRIYGKIFGKKVNKFVEKVFVKRAEALVFCSQIMKENFLESFDKYTKAPCYVVTNGFHNNGTVQPISLGKDRKNMLYAGSFHGERKIELLVKSLFKLLDEGLITKDSFCFHIFGKIKNEDKQVIEKLGLECIIKEHTPVRHEKIIKYMKDADILFLPSGTNVGYAVPYKFFDYLSIKRPIFAVAPEDSAIADLMDRIDCGKFVLINNEESILENLRAMLKKEDEYSFSGADEDAWEEIGLKYMEVIDEIE